MEFLLRPLIHKILRILHLEIKEHEVQLTATSGGMTCTSNLTITVNQNQTSGCPTMNNVPTGQSLTVILKEMVTYLGGIVMLISPKQNILVYQILGTIP